MLGDSLDAAGLSLLRLGNPGAIRTERRIDMAVQDDHPDVERKAQFRVKRKRKWNMKWISKREHYLILTAG
jgi:hypothetical protein